MPETKMTPKLIALFITIVLYNNNAKSECSWHLFYASFAISS